MEDDSLLEINESYLKKIFFQKLPDRESDSISKKLFLKFLQTTKVHPDLISSLDLKKLFNSVLRNENGEKIQEISYSKYIKLLKSLSKHCFPTENPLELLITHIKPSCLIHYQVNLIAKIQKEVYMSSTQRPRFSKYEKFPNKNTCKKSQSQKLSLSGVTSPATQSKVKLQTKLTGFRTPSLKILNQSNFIKENEKLAELRRVVEQFKLRDSRIRRKKKVKKWQMINLSTLQRFSKAGLVREI